MIPPGVGSANVLRARFMSGSWFALAMELAHFEELNDQTSKARSRHLSDCGTRYHRAGTLGWLQLLLQGTGLGRPGRIARRTISFGGYGSGCIYSTPGRPIGAIA